MLVAEAALCDSVWLRLCAAVPECLLYLMPTPLFFVVYTLVPLPVVLLELCLPSFLAPFKLQPEVYHPPDSVLRCYSAVIWTYFLVLVPLQLLSFPFVKMAGMRMGLPLPSVTEAAAQVAVYFLVEDYGNYWIHRMLHQKWWYERIHHVHHEFTAPIGFSAPRSHWAEIFIGGIPTFLGPVLVPCHVIVYWLWIVLRGVEAIENHCGYDFPFITKCIPFYGGAMFHDYHHYIGGQSKSNFASVFTYCDYIYGTDKGYRYQKAHFAKLREQLKANQIGVNGNLFNGNAPKGD